MGKSRIEVRGKNIDLQRKGYCAQDWRRVTDGRFLLPSVLQRKLPSMFRDSRTCDSELAILLSTFLAHTTADTSDRQTRLSHNALSVSLSCVHSSYVLAEDGIGTSAIARYLRL